MPQSRQPTRVESTVPHRQLGSLTRLMLLAASLNFDFIRDLKVPLVFVRKIENTPHSFAPCKKI